MKIELGNSSLQEKFNIYLQSEVIYVTTISERIVRAAFEKFCNALTIKSIALAFQNSIGMLERKSSGMMN